VSPMDLLTEMDLHLAKVTVKQTDLETEKHSATGLEKRSATETDLGLVMD